MGNESNSPVPDAPFSSHFFSIPEWGSSHMRHYSTESFSVGPSHAAVLQELLQNVSFEHGCQEQTASAWVPHGIIYSARKPTLLWFPFSLGSHILTGASYTKDISQGHSFFWDTYICSGTGSFTAGRVDVYSSMDFH